jgi:hypothetical protein
MRRSNRCTRGSAAAAGLLAALLMLEGCGGATKTVVVQGPPAQGSTAAGANTGSAETHTSSTGTSSTGTSTTTTGAAPTRILHLEAFQSPTGNIGCMLVGGIARCDIVHRTWVLPPRPASCPQIVDFGQGLEVGAGGTGRFVCAGDTARDPTSAKLAYGTGAQVGDFVCVSRSTGMTCTNRVSGHGFTLSVQQYRLF